MAYILDVLPIANIYKFLTLALFAIGGYLIYLGTFGKNILREKRSFRRTAQKLQIGFSYGDYKEKYLFIRKALFIAALLWIFTIALNDFIQAGIYLGILLILWIASKAEEKVFGRTSFFVFLKKKIQGRNETEYKAELSTLCIQLKNLVISAHGSLPSGYVLKTLIPYAKRTKPFLVNLLSTSMKGDVEEAAVAFEEDLGFPLAGNFAYTIFKMDTLPAKDFMAQLNILLEEFNAERNTYLQKKREFSKTVNFALTSGLVIALLINFVSILLSNITSMLM